MQGLIESKYICSSLKCNVFHGNCNLREYVSDILEPINIEDHKNCRDINKIFDDC